MRASVAYHGAPERFTPAEVQAMETSLIYSVPRGGFSPFFFVNFFVNHVAEAV